MREVSRLAEEALAYQEEHCFKELVNKLGIDCSILYAFIPENAWRHGKTHGKPSRIAVNSNISTRDSNKPPPK